MFSVSSEPAEHGCGTVEGGRIAAVGQAATAGAEVRDLGEVVLLPSLINAHAHLDANDPRQVPLHGDDQVAASWMAGDITPASA